MQISGGTVTYTSGSPTVQGSAGVDWSQVTVNNWFVAENRIYLISAVDNVNKTLTVSPNLLTTQSSPYVGYAIVRDFTTNHQLPLVNPGDLEVPVLLSRAFNAIDGLLGGTGGDTEITATKTGHGFVVGNVIRYKDNVDTWVLASANSATNSTIIGVVSSVVDANSFKFVTQGKVTGITNLGSVTPGTVYYLTSTATNPNLTVTAPSRKVPVMMMVSDIEGYVLSLALAEAGVFATDANGLVPAPVTATGKLLSDSGWVTPSGVAPDSITSTEMLKTGSLDWANVDTATGLSVIAHIKDLNTRLAKLETYGSSGGATAGGTKTVYSRRTNMSGSPEMVATLVLPTGVTKVKATLIAGNYISKLSASSRTQYAWGGDYPSFYSSTGWAPVSPKQYQANITFDAGSTLTIAVGPTIVGSSVGSDGYAQIRIGATNVIKVRAKESFQKTKNGASWTIDATQTLALETPYFGPLLEEDELDQLQKNTASEWYKFSSAHAPNGFTFCGVVILEYGGSIEHSF